MPWERNGLGWPMIFPMIAREERRRSSPSTVDEPGGHGLEFGVFEFVWDLGFERCQFRWDGCVIFFQKPHHWLPVSTVVEKQPPKREDETIHKRKNKP